MKRIAVIGAGSWGTALSLLLAGKGHSISLWVWDPAQAETMRRTGENPFLAGFPLPESIEIATSIPKVTNGAQYVVLATISSAVADTARQMKSSLPAKTPIISGTKGLDSETGLTVSQTLSSILHNTNPIVALSGPNLAVEVAKGIPTATVAACADESIARDAQSLLMCPSLRVYTNPDIIGVELAGALKNIIALAAGICDGLGFGDNTKAALLTRGLAEITRLGTSMGACEGTFSGLAGVGDLIATCASPLSRNRRAGIGLGQGRKLEDVTREIGQVVEGIHTTQAAYKLAREHNVAMPITKQVYQVLFEGKAPQAAVAELMTRDPKDET